MRVHTSIKTDCVFMSFRHLSNNGVQETPPSSTTPREEVDGTSSSLYANLKGANVGFQQWHPVAVTGQGNDRPAGRCEMGGVWEWTSSTLRKHEGFEPMELYPNYTGTPILEGCSGCELRAKLTNASCTADFFDDKHNIVLGGSWATHPRIAGRKSL